MQLPNHSADDAMHLPSMWIRPSKTIPPARRIDHAQFRLFLALRNTASSVTAMAVNVFQPMVSSIEGEDGGSKGGVEGEEGGGGGCGSEGGGGEGWGGSGTGSGGDGDGNGEEGLGGGGGGTKDGSGHGDGGQGGGGGIGQAGSKTRVLGSEVGRPGGADQGGEVPCRGISRLSARAPEIKPPRPRSQGINVV